MNPYIFIGSMNVVTRIAIAVIVVSIFGLVPYLSGIQVLSSINGNYILMAPSTAICFIISGIVLSIVSKKPTARKHNMAVFMSFLVVLFGVLEVLSFYIDLDLNFEDVIMPEGGNLNGIPVGRMSVATGVIFILIGFSFLSESLINTNVFTKNEIKVTSSCLSLFVLIISFTFCIAYLYGRPFMYEMGEVIPMALTTAINFTLLAIGIFFINKDYFPVSLVSGRSARSYLLRFTLPLTVFSTIIGGASVLFSTSAFNINPALATGILIALMSIVSAIIASKISSHMGKEIDKSKEQLRASHTALEASESVYRGLFDNAEVSILNEDMSLLLARLNELRSEGVSDLKHYLSGNILVGWEMLSLLKINHVNGATLEMFEIESEELFMQQIDKTFGDDAIHVFIDELCAIWSGERYFRSAAKYKTLKGKKIDAIISFRIPESDQDFKAIPVTIQDVTEFKKTQEALDKSSAENRLLINNAPYCIHQIDLGGELISMNPAGVLMMGASSEDEIVGMCYLDSVNDSDRQRISILLGSAFKGESSHFEFVSSNGRHFESSFIPIFSNEKVDRIMGLTKDVTTRKIAEDELKDREERLRITLDSIGDAVISTDINGNIYHLNPIAEFLTGWKNAEAAGLPLNDVFLLLNAKTRQTSDNPVQKVLSTGKIIGLANHTILIAKDGTERQIADSAAPIRNSMGDITGVVLVFRDVTEEHRIQEELQVNQKLRSIGTLAGGIAHDFNNILTGLYGNISMAKELIVSDKPALSLIEKAEKSIHRATHLTSQLLTFSKGGAPVKELVILKELVEDVVSFDLTGSKIKPLFNISENLWNSELDKGQIEQVFSNLAINASQAMPEGGHLYITLENVDISGVNVLGLKNGRYIRCKIRDEGIGIGKADIEQIFTPYFSTKSTGSGLGLATCYSVINRHNGHIGVNSVLGAGTTFTLHLPAAAKDLDLAEIKENSGMQINDFKPKKLLVMDDQDDIRELAKIMLESIGYEAETVADGSSAVALYKAHIESNQPFDALILDLTIPGDVGGEVTLKEILKVDPNAIALVSSGYSDGHIVANFTDYGFKGSVTKPYTRTHLLNALLNVFNK